MRTSRYCMTCGREYTMLITKAFFKPFRSCSCRPSSPTDVPDGVAFVFQEKPDINLLEAYDKRRFQYITICNECLRPQPPDKSCWKCRYCGNQDKWRTTELKLKRGVVYTWAERREETEIEVVI